MTWIDESTFVLRELRFHCGMELATTDLPVFKPRSLVEQYVRLVAELQPRRIVELGIFRGGSTILLNELARPEALVAVDLEGPVELLDDYAAEHPNVRPFYGVDQGDRSRLAAVVEGLEPLDLVLDDASHAYEPTLASFETLFPRLRPGGLYVIEDWRTSDIVAALLATKGDSVEAGLTPLSKLVLQLIQLQACTADIVSHLSVDPHWVVVRRGTEPVTTDAFDVSALAADHYGVLAS